MGCLFFVSIDNGFLILYVFDNVCFQIKVGIPLPTYSGLNSIFTLQLNFIINYFEPVHFAIFKVNQNLSQN